MINEFNLIDKLANRYGVAGKKSHEQRNFDVLYQRRVLRKALTQARHVARIREFVYNESKCGIMRSMDNTIRSNAMKDVLNFIDELDEENDRPD